MSNLKNLSKLYYGVKSYDECKSDKVGDVMHEYKNNKLKDRIGRTVINKKQAIAIALSESQAQCKYNPPDVKKLLEKVNRDLADIEKDLNLSNIIETKNAIEQLIKKKKPKEGYNIKQLLWDKIIKSQREGIKLDRNMWDEIKHIHDL